MTVDEYRAHPDEVGYLKARDFYDTPLRERPWEHSSQWPEFDAKVKEIMDTAQHEGIREPVDVQQDRMHNGAHRWEAARRLGIDLPIRRTGDVTTVKPHLPWAEFEFGLSPMESSFQRSHPKVRQRVLNSMPVGTDQWNRLNHIHQAQNAVDRIRYQQGRPSPYKPRTQQQPYGNPAQNAGGITMQMPYVAAAPYEIQYESRGSYQPRWIPGGGDPAPREDYHTYRAVTPDGQLLGRLDFSTVHYEEPEAHVEWVESHQPGVGSALLDKLYEEHPDHQIHLGMQTEEGAPFVQRFLGERPHLRGRTASVDAEDFEGTEGNNNHITRNEYGTVPLSWISRLYGMRGEYPGQHRNYQGDEWEHFKSQVAAGAPGYSDPIFVMVNHGGEPEINEGNHRRDAYQELGATHVPVQVRYFGHAEREGTLGERAGMLHEAAAIPVGRDDDDTYLRETFGVDPYNGGQLGGPEEVHPKSGYNVKTGLHRRLFIPKEGEVPAELAVDDHGPLEGFQMVQRDVAREPITHVYRGMSASEVDQALKQGFVKSDQRGTIADWEGTNAGLSPATARSYLSTSEPSVIVKIRVQPEDGWFAIPHDSYVRTRQPIPIDRIEAISKPYHYAVDPESRYGRTRLMREAALAERNDDEDWSNFYGHHKVYRRHDHPTLYHGTAAQFEPGDYIEPGHKHNFPGAYEGDYYLNYVHATPDLDNAWMYADNAYHEQPTGAGLKRHVYEVEPTGYTMQGDETFPEDFESDEDMFQQGQHMSESPFRVVREMPYNGQRLPFTENRGEKPYSSIYRGDDESMQHTADSDTIPGDPFGQELEMPESHRAWFSARGWTPREEREGEATFAPHFTKMMPSGIRHSLFWNGTKAFQTGKPAYQLESSVPDKVNSFRSIHSDRNPIFETDSPAEILSKAKENEKEWMTGERTKGLRPGILDFMKPDNDEYDSRYWTEPHNDAVANNVGQGEFVEPKEKLHPLWRSGPGGRSGLGRLNSVAAADIQHQGDSPLDYGFDTKPGDPWHPQRLAIVDHDAGGPHQFDSYFGEGGKETPAAPGTVAFVDYAQPTPDHLHIYYMNTRRDQGGRGHQRRLAEGLLARHPETKVLDFGKEFDPAVTHLRVSLQEAHPDKLIKGHVKHFGAFFDGEEEPVLSSDEPHRNDTAGFRAAGWQFTGKDQPTDWDDDEEPYWSFKKVHDEPGRRGVESHAEWMHMGMNEGKPVNQWVMTTFHPHRPDHRVSSPIEQRPGNAAEMADEHAHYQANDLGYFRAKDAPTPNRAEESYVHDWPGTSPENTIDRRYMGPNQRGSLQGLLNILKNGPSSSSALSGEETDADLFDPKVPLGWGDERWLNPEDPMRRLNSAQPDESGLKAAGIAVIAMDTGRVLMQQRALNPLMCPCGMGVTWDEQNGYQHDDGSVSHDDSDLSVSDMLDQGHDQEINDEDGEEDEGLQATAALEYDPNEGTWEFPGGKIDPGESPRNAATREFREEVGQDLPPGVFVGAWLSPGGLVVAARSAQGESRLGAVDPKYLSEFHAYLDNEIGETPEEFAARPIKEQRELADSFGNYMGYDHPRDARYYLELGESGNVPVRTATPGRTVRVLRIEKPSGQGPFGYGGDTLHPTVYGDENHDVPYTLMHPLRFEEDPPLNPDQYDVRQRQPYADKIPERYIHGRIFGFLPQHNVGDYFNPHTLRGLHDLGYGVSQYDVPGEHVLLGRTQVAWKPEHATLVAHTAIPEHFDLANMRKNAAGDEPWEEIPGYRGDLPRGMQDWNWDEFHNNIWLDNGYDHAKMTPQEAGRLRDANEAAMRNNTHDHLFQVNWAPDRNGLVRTKKVDRGEWEARQKAFWDKEAKRGYWDDGNIYHEYYDHANKPCFNCGEVHDRPLTREAAAGSWVDSIDPGEDESMGLDPEHDWVRRSFGGKNFLYRRGRDDGESHFIMEPDQHTNKWVYFNTKGHGRKSFIRAEHAMDYGNFLVDDDDYEIGQGRVLPPHQAATAPVYKGFIYLIQNERDIDLGNRELANPDDPDGDMSEQSAWWDIEHAKTNPALREEVKTGVPWDELELWADKSVRSNREVTAMVAKLAALPSDEQGWRDQFEALTDPLAEEGHGRDNSMWQHVQETLNDPEATEEQRDTARKLNDAFGEVDRRAQESAQWGRDNPGRVALFESNGFKFNPDSGRVRFEKTDENGWSHAIEPNAREGHYGTSEDSGVGWRVTANHPESFHGLGPDLRPIGGGKSRVLTAVTGSGADDDALALQLHGHNLEHSDFITHGWEPTRSAGEYLKKEDRAQHVAFPNRRTEAVPGYSPIIHERPGWNVNTTTFENSGDRVGKTTQTQYPSHLEAIIAHHPGTGMPHEAAEKCSYCKSPATKKIKHSEGMGVIAVCDKHLAKGKEDAANCTPDGSHDKSNINSVKEASGFSYPTGFPDDYVDPRPKLPEGLRYHDAPDQPYLRDEGTDFWRFQDPTLIPPLNRTMTQGYQIGQGVSHPRTTDVQPMIVVKPQSEYKDEETFDAAPNSSPRGSKTEVKWDDPICENCYLKYGDIIPAWKHNTAMNRYWDDLGEEKHEFKPMVPEVSNGNFREAAITKTAAVDHKYLSGLDFHYEPADPAQRVHYDSLRAFPKGTDPDAFHGKVTWWPAGYGKSSGKIMNVSVHDSHKRKGLATELLRRAKAKAAETGLDLRHSLSLLDEGEKMISGMGDRPGGPILEKENAALPHPEDEPLVREGMWDLEVPLRPTVAEIVKGKMQHAASVQKTAVSWIDRRPADCGYGCMVKQMKLMDQQQPIQGWMTDHRPHGGRVRWKVTNNGLSVQSGKARNATLAENDMLDAYGNIVGGLSATSAVEPEEVEDAEGGHEPDWMKRFNPEDKIKDKNPEEALPWWAVA